MRADSIIIGRQFNGPPGSANGGYAAGLLAQQLDVDTVEYGDTGERETIGKFTVEVNF